MARSYHGRRGGPSPARRASAPPLKPAINHTGLTLETPVSRRRAGERSLRAVASGRASPRSLGRPRRAGRWRSAARCAGRRASRRSSVCAARRNRRRRASPPLTPPRRFRRPTPPVRRRPSRRRSTSAPDANAEGQAEAKPTAASCRRSSPIPARSGSACAAGRPTRKPTRRRRRVAALPAPPRRKASRDDKPFDPVGVRIGDLKLTPYVEEDGGWASNPGATAGPHRGSAFETTEAGVGAAVRLVAQRAARPAEGRLHRLFRRSTPPIRRPPAARSTVATTPAATCRSTPRAASTSAQQTLTSLGLGGVSGSTEHPLVSTFGATLGGAQKFGDFDLRRCMRHSTAPTYQSIPGVDLASDNFNDWGLRGRVAYRLSEAISPFVEVGVDARRYDSASRLQRLRRAIPTVGGGRRRDARFHPPTDRRGERRLRRARSTAIRACRISAVR